jgi:hypothetical protein
MKNYLDIVLGVCALIGIIWRIAQVYLETKISNLQKDLEVHLTEYSGKKELLEYQLNGMNQKIDHKFSRCWIEVKQQQAFLVKQGFVPREDNTL